jgi:hypothetical protein
MKVNAASLVTASGNMLRVCNHVIHWTFNHLTPKDFWRRHTASPLNGWTRYKDVVNSVSKFGGILFTPIWLTSVVCYASAPLKVRLSFRSQNVLPPPPKPLHIHWHIRRHLVTVHFSQMTNMVLTLLALTIACSGLHCGLKYQHWPVRWTLVVDQNGFQWHTVPI